MMLVLTRDVDQSVIIGGNIKVMVVEVRPGKVRLGFEAPRGVAIHREEIQDLIDQQEAEKRLPPDCG